MKSNPRHKFPEHEVLKHVYNSEIATIFFYNNVVVVEAFEGVTLSYKTGFSILLKSIQITKFKPCIYISNRINSYSVNPNDYKYLNKVPSIKGIAIVTNLESTRKNAELEKNFSTKPLEIFEDISEAYQWGMEKLKKEIK